MTNEEAIKLINTMLLVMHLSDPSIAIGGVEEVEIALNMAIKALKQTDGDLISRTDLLKDITELKKSPWFNDGKDIKDLFQQNSYIARKEAIEIIEDLCIKKLTSIDGVEKTIKNE